MRVRGQTPLPVRRKVGDIVGMLIDKSVTATRGVPLTTKSKGAYAFCFEDDMGRPSAVILADKELMCRAGGALVVKPKVMVDQELRNASPPDDLLENFSEIVNVLAQLLNAEGSPHVKRGAIYVAKEAPEAVKRIVASPSKRNDLKLDVSGYGEGLLSVCLA